MQSEVERIRQELEQARETSERLWAEYREHVATLPPREVATPEELRRMQQASEWTRKIYAAEQALFIAEHRTPGVVGSHEKYQWLSMHDADISDLLRLCPDVVLDRYLAVTSIDGATLNPSGDEMGQGWWTAESAKVFSATSWSGPDYRGGTVAYSPRITSIHGLPNETRDECSGFEEWLLFEHPVTAGETEVFVNWVGFRLYDPDYQWCADRLWNQLERLAPESYIAHGTVFTFATRNGDLYRKVLAAFSASVK